MKRLLLVLPVLGLAACAGQRPASTNTSTAYHNDALPDENREPSHVHTYLVNDYLDPNNPRLRHRGHAVDVVEQDERWKLDSSSDGDISAGNYGPATTTENPNAAPNPYSAEFETELSQQRDQYKQLASLGTQMNSEMGRLQALAEKQADAVADNAILRTRLEDLQREIDELKPAPASPVSPYAPSKPSWVQSILDLFRQLPDGAPVATDKPTLRTNLTLQPVPPAPAASTNAPGELPSPGEMAEPQNAVPTNTP